MNFKKEIIRKSLHLPGILFLFLGQKNLLLSLGLLSLLILLYYFSIFLKKRAGIGIPLVEQLTQELKRNEEIDLGPPCLGSGIIFAIAFFDFPIAACAVFQICIADSLAAIVGKGWGRKKIFYSSDKSYLGSLCFFIAAFLAQLPFVSAETSLILAIVGTLLESLPFGAIDNFLVPFGVTLFAQIFLSSSTL